MEKRKKYSKGKTRLSAPELSLQHENSFFRVAEWIYSQDDSINVEDQLQVRTEERPKTSLQKVRLPTPYLVNREASEMRSRKPLIKALCSNPMAFYYYKQRHLFKPYTRKSQRSSLSPEHRNQRPATTMQLRRTRPAETHESRRTHRSSPSPVKGEFLQQLLAKCEEVPPSVTARTLKEREALRLTKQKLVWTQQTLEKVSDCDPDLLIPFYLGQREALQAMHSDVKQAAEDLRQSAITPGVIRARFERVLRRNKNIVL